jgi:hypothetical protein
MMTVFLSVWLKQGFQREILFKTRSAGVTRAGPLKCVRQKDTRVRKRAYASRALKSINPGASKPFSLALSHGCNRKGFDDLREHGRPALRLLEVPTTLSAAGKTAPHSSKVPRPRPSPRKTLPTDQKTTIIALARPPFAR